MILPGMGKKGVRSPLEFTTDRRWIPADSRENLSRGGGKICLEYKTVCD